MGTHLLVRPWYSGSLDSHSDPPTFFLPVGVTELTTPAAVALLVSSPVWVSTLLTGTGPRLPLWYGFNERVDLMVPV